MSRVDPPPFNVAWHAVSIASALLVVTGTVGVLIGARSWAWAIVIGFGAGSASSIGLALVEYRRTMRRQWPRVAALTDDDWDD